MTSNFHTPHAIGAPLTAAEVNAPLAALDAQVGRLSSMQFNVLDYDATGDGVTDDLAAFNTCTAACAAAGGGIIVVPNGTYYLSDNWLIDMEKVHVECAPDATIFTTAPTTTGGTIAAIGHYGQGTAITPQREWFSWRGGIVYNTDATVIDNGIGIVRWKTARVEGVRLPTIGRKAITAQYGVDNVYILDNIIGTTGHYGISVESTCDYVHVVGNAITAAGEDGIYVSSMSGGTIITDAHVERNIIYDADANGVVISGVTRGWVVGNTILSAALSGVNIGTGADISVRDNIISLPGYHGITFATTSGRIDIVGNFLDRVGQALTNTYDAIVCSSCTGRPIIIGNRVAGTDHRYAVNMVSMSGYQPVSNGNVLLTGATGAYGGWLPVLSEDLVDGLATRIAYGTAAGVMLHVVQGTAAPASGAWLRGDICWNTTPSAAGVPGWVCTGAGTPGTWKAMAVLAT